MRFLQLTGRFLAIALLILIITLKIISLIKFPYFIPASNVEEVAYTYTSAHNYLTFGFFNSGLLQDFSNSPNPLDHPYVYTHYPPGPDLFTAIILLIFNNNYQALYMVMAFTFLIGCWNYLKFSERLLQKFQLTGASYTLLLMAPWSIMATLARLQSAPLLLLIFAPLNTLQHYYQTQKKISIYLTYLIILISSYYIEYNVLIGVIISWIILYNTKLIRLKKNHLFNILGTFALGITIKLIQNILFLGLDTAIQELSLTLSNRIIGIPTRESLKEFFRSIYVVHHGSPALNYQAFINGIWSNFQVPGDFYIMIMAILLALVFYFKLNISPVVSKNELSGNKFLKLWGWIIGTVLIPTLLFPAYTQQFTLFSTRANLYFLNIGLVAIIGESIRQIINNSRVIIGQFTFKKMMLLRVILVSGLSAGLFFTITTVFYANLNQLQSIRTKVFEDANYIHLIDLRRFDGQLYMTNINTPTVGFFAQAPGYGVCGPDSLTDTDEIKSKNCQIALMRRQDYYAKQRPKYFFLLRDFYPGFAECQPKEGRINLYQETQGCIGVLYRRLNRYQKIFENPILQVYDLTIRKSR